MRTLSLRLERALNRTALRSVRLNTVAWVCRCGCEGFDRRVYHSRDRFGAMVHFSVASVSYSLPDGRPLLRDVSLGVGSGERVALIGANGTGKSTLLRHIAGELSPDSGHLTVRGTADYLPQRLTLVTDATVAAFFGVHGILDALDRIEHGTTDPADFDAIGDRCLDDLAAAGLEGIQLARRVGTLSGEQTAPHHSGRPAPHPP